MNRQANTSATRLRASATPVVVLAIAGALPFMTGCAVIGGIFKAGVGVGIFIVVAVIAAVVGLGMAFSKK